MNHAIDAIQKSQTPFGFLHQAFLLFRRRHWNGKQLYFREANGREVDALLPIRFTPSFAKAVGMPGQQLWVQSAFSYPGAKYVILMDTSGDLAFPYPSAPELISVSPFIEQHIPYL